MLNAHPIPVFRDDSGVNLAVLDDGFDGDGTGEGSEVVGHVVQVGFGGGVDGGGRVSGLRDSYPILGWGGL